MATFDEMKNQWERTAESGAAPAYDQNAVEKIIRARARREKNTVMKYFWASFTLQIIVYALLSHVIVRFGSDVRILLMGVGGIVIFIPFTIMLLKKFKSMAVNKPAKGTDGDDIASLHHYVLRQYDLLKGFYRFKRSYEIVLTPLGTAIGTYLVFQLYFPGGAIGNPGGLIGIFLIALISCGYAIHRENRKYFREPLSRLEAVLEEFRS